MSILDDFVSKLTPHISKLNQNIAVQGAHVHNRLGRIEDLVSDLARGDIGDMYIRLRVNTLGGVAPIERQLIGKVRTNELLSLQAIASNGQILKTPALVIDAGRVPVAYLVKEGAGYESIGGNIVFLPGEEIGITALEALGTNPVDLTLTFIRRLLPVENVEQANLGPNAEAVGGKPSHDIARDEIAARPGPWTATGAETRNTEGATQNPLDPTEV